MYVVLSISLSHISGRISIIVIESRIKGLAYYDLLEISNIGPLWRISTALEGLRHGKITGVLSPESGIPTPNPLPKINVNHQRSIFPHP